jgi:hypothetical protein
MIVLAIGLISTIGISMAGEHMHAMNMTLKNPTDDRVRFDTITFEDGKVCTVYGDIYSFDTVQNAMQRWNSWSPPVLMKRNVPVWNIFNLDCTVRDSLDYTFSTVIFSFVTLTSSFIFDTLLAISIQKWYRSLTPRSFPNPCSICRKRAIYTRVKEGDLPTSSPTPQHD